GLNNRRHHLLRCDDIDVVAVAAAGDHAEAFIVVAEDEKRHQRRQMSAFAKSDGLKLAGAVRATPWQKPHRRLKRRRIRRAMPQLAPLRLDRAESRDVGDDFQRHRAAHCSGCTTIARLARLVDLSHAVADGTITYPGLPAPKITDHLSREASRANYAPGTTSQIARLEMVANTGTYVDAPSHRWRGRWDGAPL